MRDAATETLEARLAGMKEIEEWYQGVCEAARRRKEQLLEMLDGETKERLTQLGGRYLEAGSDEARKRLASARLHLERLGDSPKAAGVVNAAIAACPLPELDPEELGSVRLQGLKEGGSLLKEEIRTMGDVVPPTALTLTGLTVEMQWDSPEEIATAAHTREGTGGTAASLVLVWDSDPRIKSLEVAFEPSGGTVDLDHVASRDHDVMMTSGNWLAAALAKESRPGRLTLTRTLS